ncbi:hypothetical protein [Nonomuraea sp. NPDC050691]|uniref:hypothetical protein n=1 Tax=Nonomuraea sp. NPDC050691 TaxID=3155661 RepID=UPI0033D2D56E
MIRSYTVVLTVPVSAEIVGSTVNPTWKARTGTSNYSVLDERNGEVVWTGTTPYASVSLDEEGYASLVARADSTPIAKYVVSTANPDLGLSPVIVVTSLTATNLEWLSENAPLEEEEEYHLAADEAGDTILPEAATQMATPLGEAKQYAIEVGTSEPVEPGDDGGEEAAPEPPADETGDGIAQDGTTSPPAPTDMPPVPMYGIDVTAPLTAEELADTSDSTASTQNASFGSPHTSIQNASVNATAGKTVRESWITYEGYIPSRSVKGPPVGCGSPSWWYAGDNRGPGFNTGKYRTRVAIKYMWSSWSHLQQIVGYRDNHTTTRFKLDGGRVVDRESSKAPLTGIDVVRWGKTTKKAHSQIIHASKNPFCAGGDIDYNSTQHIYKSGKYKVFGWHDQMPVHEVYRQQVYTDGSKSLKRVFTHKMKGLHCLLPTTCKYRTYQYVN